MESALSDARGELSAGGSLGADGFWVVCLVDRVRAMISTCPHER